MREPAGNTKGAGSGPGAEAAFEPAYLELLRTGALEDRAREALARLISCDLCARYCRVDRTVTLRGVVCRTGRRAVVSSFFPHHGEEAPVSGVRGSGTIFFAWCNLRCVFCQNWELSWKGQGHEVGPQALAAMMLSLQEAGCHNINFVTPSHVVAQILEALVIAAERGLRLPLVYNTGGYDSPEALALLDGVIDIYMPDMKYGDSEEARTYSHVRDYVCVNRAAVREMHRQVGDLVLDEAGAALRGLLVRHLVLPEDLAGTEEVLRFIAEEISPHTYINLMDQYRPCFKAHGDPRLGRPLTSQEYRAALEAARHYGLTRLDPGSAAHALLRWAVI
jgi:putative pyruvate formate lyase activating enzyme